MTITERDQGAGVGPRFPRPRSHGLDPRAYLHAVAKALIGGHSHTKLDELLPDAMLRAHPELANPLHAAPDKTATKGDAKALPDHVAEARAA